MEWRNTNDPLVTIAQLQTKTNMRIFFLGEECCKFTELGSQIG